MTIEEKIIELQKQIDELKAEVKNKFKRVDKHECYYAVEITCGKAKKVHSHDVRDNIDNGRFENNNYFLTEERAKEVAEKINTLLKMERIYDMLCPEYKPNWNDEDVSKCNISMDGYTGAIERQLWGVKKIPTMTYFPENKIEEAIKLYKEMS